MPIYASGIAQPRGIAPQLQSCTKTKFMEPFGYFAMLLSIVSAKAM
jgi:hypothetical protein